MERKKVSQWALRIARLGTAVGVIGSLLLASRSSLGAPDSEASPYRVAGQYVEVCTCPGICESALGAPSRWGCAFVAAMRVDAGQRGEVPLSGRSIAIVAAPAGAARGSEERPTAVSVFVDPKSTAQQAVAMVALATDKFGARFASPLPAPRAAEIHLDRSADVVSVEVDGVASVRARPLVGQYRRLVQIQNAPGAAFSVLFVGRGAAGQVADGATGVRFDGEGRSVLYGKFDFASGPPGRARK